MFNNSKSVTCVRLLCAGTLLLPFLLAGCDSQQSANTAGRAVAPTSTPTKSSSQWVLPSENDHESDSVTEPVVETAGLQVSQGSIEGIGDPLSMVNAYFDALNAGEIANAFSYIDVELTEYDFAGCTSGYLYKCKGVPIINPQNYVIPVATVVTGEGDDYYNIEFEEISDRSAWLVENNGWKFGAGPNDSDLIPLEFALPPEWQDILSEDTVFSVNGVEIPFQDGKILGTDLVALTLTSYLYPFVNEITVDVSHGGETVPIRFVTAIGDQKRFHINANVTSLPWVN